ncbi:MAG: isochorismatase family protein [Variovorax sp.]
MLLDADDCQLVLVDYQARLLPALHQGAEAVANAVRLAKTARLLSVPVWGTEQTPAKLGENMPELRELCQRTLAKTHFSAAGEGLIEWLHGAPAAQLPKPMAATRGNARSLPRHARRAPEPELLQDERTSIVIAGCEAHVCLLQTALELLEAEFDVWVVTDACASRTERNRDAAFDRLVGAGCELVTTEMVGFEWLRASTHPAFREWQGLIR